MTKDIKGVMAKFTISAIRTGVTETQVVMGIHGKRDNVIKSKVVYITNKGYSDLFDYCKQFIEKI